MDFMVGMLGNMTIYVFFCVGQFLLLSSKLIMTTPSQEKVLKGMLKHSFKDENINHSIVTA